MQDCAVSTTWCTGLHTSIKYNADYKPDFPGPEFRKNFQMVFAKKCETMYVPNDMHSAVLTHVINRRDNDIQRQQPGIVLASRMQAITIGSTDIQHRYEMDDQAFADLVASMYVKALICRQHTRGIGKIVNLIQQIEDASTKEKINLLWDSTAARTKHINKLTHNGMRSFGRAVYEQSKEHAIAYHVIGTGRVVEAEMLSVEVKQTKVEIME